jgi:hypothetical protein
VRDGEAVRVRYEVRVGTPLGRVLLSAVPHVRAATARARATVVVEVDVASMEMLTEVLRPYLAPGVELERLRVTTGDRVTQLRTS